jgi:hypothetical protein
MQTSPLARHLVTIGTSQAAVDAADVLAPHGATHSIARLAAAESEGYERGRAMAEAALAQRFQEQERHLDERLDAMRREWVAQQADHLERTLAESVTAMQAELADAVARTLLPFVERRLRQDALDEIALATEDLVKESLPLSIELSGPADLTSELAKRLDGLSTVCRVVANAGVELRVRAENKVLQTRIREFCEMLEDAVR